MINKYSEHSKILQNLERELFHGTREEIANQILDEGFNPAFSSRKPENGRYGQGGYFARDLRYSADDSFAEQNDIGHKFVIVAQILVGATLKV